MKEFLRGTCWENMQTKSLLDDFVEISCKKFPETIEEVMCSLIHFSFS